METELPHRAAAGAGSEVEGEQFRQWRHHEGPDAALLSRLIWLERACLALVGLIAGVILAAWIVPPLGHVLFSSWTLMKANTALLLLLSSASLALSQGRSDARRLTLSRWIGLAVFLASAAVLLEYAVSISLGVDTWLAADAGSLQPGRMSPQTAFALALLGVAAIFIRTKKRPAAHVVDGVVFTLCPLAMIVVSGYAFGVLHLFGVSEETRTSPHTLLCLMLLSFVVFARRTENGFLSILAGTGIGSKIARIACPLALVVPFLLEAGRFGIVRLRWLTPAYSTALVTASAGVMGFALILLLAWRIDGLEEKIRDLSLRDDLTGLYNRRGFFLFGEREFALSARSQVPFSVLFIDLDGLKSINDKLGHEAGSTFLREMAALLRKSFRDSDILARIGGDEFVVAGTLGASGVTQAALRLERAAADRNAAVGNAYPLEFSIGYAISDMERGEGLEELLGRADSAMYARKREKKMAR
jgi:diguanylate cyclase (GGDEF)-like protein